MFKLFLVFIIVFNCCHAYSVKYLKEFNSRLKGTTYFFQFPDGKYNSTDGFLGIRYAKAPIGDLRFKAPVEEDWESMEYDLKNSGNQCMYMENGDVFGNEDCLNLDVYVPTARNRPSEMPTFVYFNNPGDVEYKRYTNPESPFFLLRHNMVVLYVVNYRVGPFGFLHTKTHKIPANIGLQDQLMAMKWITKNNHYFEGKSPFTIIGDYDSASHAYLHMFSEKSKGKFNALITHSSNGFGTWKMPTDNSKLTYKMARKVYCDYENEDNVVDCLQYTDAEDILLATSAIDKYGEGVQNVFKPIIEGDQENAFLPENPLTVLSNSDGSDVPWLNGRFEQSGLRKASVFLKSGNSLQDFDFAQLLPDHILNSELGYHELVEELKKIYTASSDECNNAIDMFTDFDILASDDAMMLQYLYRNQSAKKYVVPSDNTLNYRMNLCEKYEGVFPFPEISSINSEDAVTSLNSKFVAFGSLVNQEEETAEDTVVETNERIEKIRNLFSTYTS